MQYITLTPFKFNSKMLMQQLYEAMCNEFVCKGWQNIRAKKVVVNDFDSDSQFQYQLEDTVMTLPEQIMYDKDKFVHSDSYFCDLITTIKSGTSSNNDKYRNKDVYVNF